MSRPWPMVGRAEELRYVRHLVEAGDASGVVIAGQAGVGKTRLASELRSAAAAAGETTVWAVATRSTASIPFGALSQLLPRAPRSAGSRLEVLRGALDALARRAGDRGVFLGVDDAHLLDDCSAALVHQAAINRAAFLVLTVRTGEPAPDAVTALWKERLVERLELQPLAADEIEDLIERALPGQVDAPTLHRLRELSRGNVLFLHELLVGGVESGAMVCTDGIWRWLAPQPPARLVELVETRLANLNAAERTALEIVAAGEPLSEATLLSLAGRRAVESLERRGLLEVMQSGRRSFVRMFHPLYSEVVKEQTPPSAVREIRLRLARELERVGARRKEDLLQIAVWHLDVGLASEPGLLLRGAAEALGRFDHGLAERLARAALDAGGGSAAVLQLAEALIFLDRDSEAEAVLEGFASDPLSDEQRARLAELQARIFFRLGRPADAEAILRKGEELLTSVEHRARLGSTRARFLVQTGRFRDALEAASAVLLLPGPPAAGAEFAKLAAVAARAALGQAADALTLVDGWLGRPETPGEAAVQLRLRLLQGRVLLLILLGRLIEAERAAAEGYRTAIAQPIPAVVWNWAWFLGWVNLQEGRMRSASRRLREAAQQIRLMGPSSGGRCLAQLAQAAAIAGNAAGARAALAEVESLMKRSAPPVYASDKSRAQAWLLAMEGRVGEARRLLHEAADQAAAVEELYMEASALHDSVRLGDTSSSAARLRALAQVTEGRLVDAMAAHATALATGDGASLDRVSESFREMGAGLFAAEAAFQAARAHQDAGLRLRSLASAATGRALLDACEGARTPAVSLRAELFPLTDREFEVATLAAAGLTSREVAERLSVSVRTVDNHLQQVYGKLDLSRRQDLRPLFHSPTGPAAK